MKTASSIAALAAVFLSSACSSPAEVSYRPLSTLTQDKAVPPVRDTIAGDFAWAAQSATPMEAVNRWLDFLKRHAPPNAEFEDGFHARHVGAARVELIRAYYLAGQVEEADELLRRLGLSPASILE